MVAIVSGNGAGLLNTSGNVLGQNGLFGNATVGSSKERAYVNVANGNLALQDQDDYLAAAGIDLALTRTYNSQGTGSDGVGAQWKLGVAKRITNLTGTVNTAGSTLTRIDGDGTAQLYTCDANGIYVSTDGAGAYQTIKQTADGGWVWMSDHKDQQGLNEVYDSTGRIQSVNDQAGVRLGYQYDASGHVQQITDSSGDTTYFDFNGDNLTQIRTRVAGSTTDFVRVSYGYDTSNRLVTTTVDLTPEDKTDAKSYTTTYGYDSTSNRIASLTQSDGTALNFAYVSSGGAWKVSQVTAWVNGQARITKYDYTVAGKTTVTDPLLNKTEYAYDAKGQLAKVTEPAVNGLIPITSFIYDAYGNVTQITGPGGQISTAEYDANGNQTKFTDAIGNVTVRQFDPANNLLLNETVQNSTTGAVPQTTLFAYDAGHRLRFAVSSEGRVTEYVYNANGQRQKTIQYTQSRYDMGASTASTMISESSMAAWASLADRGSIAQTTYTYDARGLLYTETTYASADANGGPVATADSPAAVTVYTYDQAGQLLSKSGAKGNVTYTYDGLGRLLSTTDIKQNTTSNTYTDAGNTLSTTMANGLTTISAFNAAGELVSVTQQDSAGVVIGVSRYTYDAEGRLVMAVDPDGVRTFKLYDADGRLAADIDGDGTMTEYFYDASSNLTRTTRYAARLTTSTLVDANGVYLNKALATIRPVANATSDRSTWNIYDKLGRLVDSADGEGNVTHRDYVLGQLVAVTERFRQASVSTLATINVPTSFTVIASPADDRVTRMFYDEDNKPVGTLDAAGNFTEQRYDAAGRLIETISYAKPTTNAAGATLAAVRPLASEGDIHQRHVYDSRGRLVGTVDGKGYLTESVYSPEGNLTRTKTYGTVVGTTFADNATIDGLRPAAASPDDRQVDYEYNELNQLAREIASTGTVTTYAYDKVGNVASKTVGLASDPRSGSQYQYDERGHLVKELSPIGVALVASGTIDSPTAWRDYVTTYKYDGAGLRTSMTDPLGNKTLYYYDGDGRLAYTVNALGQVRQTAYNAFGQVERVIQFANTIAASKLALMTGGLATSESTTFTGLVSTNDSVETYTYNRDGKLTDKLDADGYHLWTQYDPFGEVIGTYQSSVVNASTLTQGTAKVARMFYDKAGNVAMTVTGAGGVTVYQYDGNGHITDKITYANVVTLTSISTALATDVTAKIVADPVHDFHQRYFYDTRGMLVGTLTATETSSGSQVWSAERRAYDASGNLIEQTRFAKKMVADAPTVHSIENAAIDNNDEVVRYYYDGQNRLAATATAQRWTSQGREWAIATREYDSVGNVIATTRYDTVLKLADPKAADIANFVQAQGPGRSQVTRYVYNRANQLVATAVAQDIVDGVTVWSVTKNDYDGKSGRLLAQTQRATKLYNGSLALNPTPADYDAWILAGAAVTSDMDRTTRYGYDVLGRVTTTIDPAGSVTQRVFDAKGNVAKTIAYATPDTGTGPIPAGYAPATSPADRVTRTVYDKENQAVYTIDAMGVLTAYAYDALGNVVKTTEYATPLTLSTLPDLPLPADIKLPAGGTRISRRAYDQAGQLRFEGDNAGFATETRYDGVGRVVKTLDSETAPYTTDTPPTSLSAGSRIKQYFYDAQGNLSSMIDADLTTESYQYDGAGNRISFTNKATNTWTYEYDAAGRMVTETTPPVTMYANAPYTPQANVSWDSTHAQTTAPVITRITYDAFGNVKTRTEAAGTAQERTTTYVYDAAGRQVKTILPSVPVFNDTTDAFSSLMPSDPANEGRYERDSGELSVVVTYDAFGDAISNKDVGGYVSEKAYDAHGLVVYERDAQNYVTEYQRDVFGNVTKLIRHANIYTGSMTAGLGTIKDAIGAGSPDDRAIVNYYDALGRVVKSVEPESYVFDPNAGLQAPVLAARTTDTEYNGYGEVISRSIYGADKNGNKITPAAQTRYYYNIRGQKSAELAVVQDAAAGQQAYGYVTAFAYTAAGQLQSTTEFVNRVKLYGDDRDKTTYANPGNAEQNRTTDYTYDKVGNKLTETHYTYTTQLVNSVLTWITANVTTTTFTYNALGNQTSSVDALGGAIYTGYDVLGRVTAVKKAQTATVSGITTAGSPLTEFKLDVYGNVVLRIDYAQGAADNTATNFAALAPTDAENRKTATAYDLNGHAIEVVSGVEGGETGQFAPRMTFTSYDAFGRAVRKWTPFTDNDAAKTRRVAYTVTNYDSLGRIASVVTPANVNNVDGTDTNRITTTTTYHYDAFGELIRRDLNDGMGKTTVLDETTYDSAGNAWRTNAGDGVTKVTLYDIQGDATSSMRSATTSLYFNPLNTLTSVKDVLSINNLLRTDTAYDLLGHALSISNVSELKVLRYVRTNTDAELLAGAWTEVADNFRPDDMLVVARPEESAKTVTVSYRIKGSTAWTTAPAERVQLLNGYHAFATAGLPDGSYEFQVTMQGTGETAYVSASGIFNVTAATSQAKDQDLIRLYAVVLNRAPTQAELNQAVARMNNGTTIVQLAKELLATAEAKAYLGTTGDSVMARIFTDAFASTAASGDDTNDQATWAWRFNQTTTPPWDNQGQTIVDLINQTLTPLGGEPHRVASSVRLQNRTAVLAAYMVDNQGADPATAARLMAAADAASASGASIEPVKADAAASALRDRQRLQLAQLYVAVFGRAPDPVGMAYWLAAVQGDAARIDAAADAIFNSDEAKTDPLLYPTANLTQAQYLQQLVSHVFQNMLDRLPSTAELASWTATLDGSNGAAPLTKGAFLMQLASSVATYNGTDAARLQDKQLFNNRVGVALAIAGLKDTGGNPLPVDAGVARLVIASVGADTSTATAAAAAITALGKASASASQINAAASSLAASTQVEAARFEVSRLYAALLGRAPDAVGMAYYMAAPPATAQDWAGMADSLLNSAESRADGALAAYKNVGGSLVARTNGEFVQRIYELALGQSPLQPSVAMGAEIAAFAQRLDNGESRGSVAVAIVNGMLSHIGISPAEMALRDKFDNKAAVGVAFAIDLGANNLQLARDTVAKVTATDMKVALDYAYASRQPAIAAAFAGNGTAATQGSAALNAEVTALNDKIATATSASTAATALNGTANAAAMLSLVQTYVGLFGRTPDVAGLKANFNALSNAPVAQVVQGMYDAAEISGSTGRYPPTLTDAQFIAKVYASILGQDINNPPAYTTWPGATTYLQQLQSGTPRGQVWFNILNSVISYANSQPDAAAVQFLQYRSSFVAKVSTAMQTIDTSAHTEYDPILADDTTLHTKQGTLQTALTAANTARDSAMATAATQMSTVNNFGDGLAQYRLRLTMLYATLLKRTTAPTLAELAVWTDNNVPLDQVANSMMTGSEAGTTFTSLDNTAFVGLLYQRILHRSILSSDGSFWVDALASGTSRGRAAVDMLEDYINYSDHTAAQLTAKASFDTTIDSMLSTETSGALTSKSTAYNTYLSAHSATTTAQTNYNTAVTTRDSALTAMNTAVTNAAPAHTIQAYANTSRQFDDTYIYIGLRGYTDIPGLAFWMAGNDDNTLISSLMPAGGTNSSFVSTLYTRVMAKTITTTELNSWTAQLDSGASTRLDVAKAILYSSAAHTRLDPLTNTAVTNDNTKVNTLISTETSATKTYNDAVTAVDSKYQILTTAQATEKAALDAYNKALNVYNSLNAVTLAHRYVTTADSNYSAAVKALDDYNANQALLIQRDAQVASLKPYVQADDAALTAAKANASLASAAVTMATAILQDTNLTATARQVRQVAQLYQTLVGTPPTLSALQYWVGKLAAGTSLVDVISGIMNGRKPSPPSCIRPACRTTRSSRRCTAWRSTAT